MNQTNDTNTDSSDDDTAVLIYTVIMTSLSSVGLCFSAIAVLVLRRTRRTPETACFLHSGLLILNMTGLTFLMVRQLLLSFQSDLGYSLTMFGRCFLTLAQLTLGLMSVERLVLFSAPYFYSRVITPKKVKIITCSFWISFTILYLFGGFVFCSRFRSSITNIDGFDKCGDFFRPLTISFGCMISMAVIGSYIQIYRIERRKNGHDERTTCLTTIKTILSYKSTSIVILNIFTTYTIAIIVFFFGGLYFNKSIKARFVVFDFVSIMSSITDPVLYVVWFKECRYEIMKMFTCNSRHNPKLEKMRMEIFSIVVKKDASI